MSIIPVGNRKTQISQGPLKNESILDNIIFKKIAINTSGLTDIPKEQFSQQNIQNSNDLLNEALGGGGLDYNRMSDQLEQQSAPNDIDISNTQGITPASGAPADQFLEPIEEHGTQQSNINPYESEVQKIRQFIGYQNYDLSLTPQKDGSLEVVITPSSEQFVDIGRLMSGLKQVTQGEWKGESTPATVKGGPVTLKYVPQNMLTQKVQKGRR